MNESLLAAETAGISGTNSPVTEPNVVTLTIPCAAEYVGTARLTILGVASRMGFSYDQVEDIRLAVGEACTNAIARAEESAIHAKPTITISSHIEPKQLVVEIEDTVVGTNESIPVDLEKTTGEEVNPAELGALLMEILVDEVAISTKPTGTHVRLTKYAVNATG